MGGIWTMGELLVEIMREEPGKNFLENGVFLGPFPSGAPAIFADTVARLGLPSGIIGVVGEDDFGQSILNRLRSDGVDCTKVQKGSESTGVAFVMYEPNGSRKYLFHFSNSAAVQAKFDDAGTYFSPDYFHMMGCSLSASPEFAEEIMRAMRYFIDKGSKISFDPNIRAELLDKNPKFRNILDQILEETSLLFPSIEELLLLTHTDTIEDGIRSLFVYPKLQAIVLKRGPKGCTIYTREMGIDVPAYEVKEIDPTGAGDCFDAGFLVAILKKADLEQAAKIANAAGALNANAFGPMEGHISIGEINKLTGLEFV